MQELIHEMMWRMLQRVEKEVPETGDFEMVEEGFENPDPQLGVQRFWLEVAPPPEGVTGREWIRSLKLVADNREGAAVEMLLESGPKPTIQDALRSENIEERIVRSVDKLEYHLRGL